MQDILKLFPSVDGNEEKQQLLLESMQKIIKNLDQLKNEERATLGKCEEKSEGYYNDLIHQSHIPLAGITMSEVIEELNQFMNGHPYPNKYYLSNAVPLPSIPSLLGVITMALLNGNGVWDVYGPGAAEAEVKVVSMLSKLIGYNPQNSGGYTTWGGQGCVFSSLRLAISKQFPLAKEHGAPQNVYCFASENAHYSLLKSAEATGIGSNHLIKVKTDPYTNSMDIEDLEAKMIQVIKNGGIPLYILATMGSTDTFTIDDIKKIKESAEAIQKKYKLKPIYIHADSAMGGFYSFFNNYSFEENPLSFESNVKNALQYVQDKMQYMSLADSVCFDFHKLGQTPYTSSILIVKNHTDLQLMDIEQDDTPYLGNRSYGSYHTGYTLECSRAGSAIPMYINLLAFGIEGYQKLLANYIHVNLLFREKLGKALPQVAITNDFTYGPITTFRFYMNGDGQENWEKERIGLATKEEIEDTNRLNIELFNYLGENRDQVFFGDTTRSCVVDVINSYDRNPISTLKFFSISPYTTVECIDEIVEFLYKHISIATKQIHSYV
ncbi:TPA: pyridoxal phosphate-dependent decarboxylase family protein [Bacillus thuringiensis]|uniref:Aspartate aminotransferase family protein n=2 Tax=Bacillus thuringiensis TaxID=1428 RepID=A0A9X6KNV9_BACTU|nr:MULTISPECIES: pyridoxal-dependent decarboxylase [Bacillus cereus group]AJA23170.1 2,4-diaminobutyrate decarboxylase [Bacillus thuringiensis serovar galleriae]ETE94397.1 2,4-diaminobutyrate decarboxylase [Bacillus thuringiensis serovar aizawai str. Leapi01]ETE96900.1 2,4-diaminobutyrate decarboxylase [Bacillus thuringiensis serovar aizawai str. Hu4-2]KAB1375214.1 aspartate aminotransferase family protein [Bacillus thuringiensis]KLA10414.1 Glutamate decarboxylase [Bacillus cereus]